MTFWTERRPVLLELARQSVLEGLKEYRYWQMYQSLGKYDQELAREQKQKPLPVRPAEGLDFAGLPADWLAGLYQAVIEADPQKIIHLVVGIRTQRPALAAALLELIDNFDYQPILTAIDQHLRPVSKKRYQRQS